MAEQPALSAAAIIRECPVGGSVPAVGDDGPPDHGGVDFQYIQFGQGGKHADGCIRFLDGNGICDASGNNVEELSQYLNRQDTILVSHNA